MIKLKQIIILTLLFILSNSFSCEKEGSITNNPPGEYTYTSFSEFYLADNSHEASIISEGELKIVDISIIDSAFIEIFPDTGYIFKIAIQDIEIIGDTTAFVILLQPIKLYQYLRRSDDFNLFGLHNLEIGGLKKYDGYFTDDEFFMEYKSVNASSQDWVITQTTAIKKD